MYADVWWRMLTYADVCWRTVSEDIICSGVGHLFMRHLTIRVHVATPTARAWRRHRYRHVQISQMTYSHIWMHQHVKTHTHTHEEWCKYASASPPHIYIYENIFCMCVGGGWVGGKVVFVTSVCSFLKEKNVVRYKLGNLSSPSTYSTFYSLSNLCLY